MPFKIRPHTFEFRALNINARCGVMGLQLGLLRSQVNLKYGKIRIRFNSTSPPSLPSCHMPFSAVSGTTVVPLRGHDSFVLSAAFGTRIVSESADKTSRIWDAVSGPGVVPFEGTMIESHSLLGKLSLQDKTVRIWDAVSGIEMGPPMRGHNDVVTSAAFSPDHSTMLCNKCHVGVYIA